MPFRIAEIDGLKALSDLGGLDWASSASNLCCKVRISSRSLEVSDSCARTGAAAAASAATHKLRSMVSPWKKRIEPPHCCNGGARATSLQETLGGPREAAGRGARLAAGDCAAGK